VTAPKSRESVVLRDLNDAEGTRHLEAELRQGGAIVITGQDLGPGVSRVFGPGNDEYEWAWSIEPEAIPAMVAALGGLDGDDPLRLLKSWSDANGGRDPGGDLRKAGVPIEFWNRVG